MTRLLPSRYILHRGVLIGLLAAGSPDRAPGQSQALVSNLDEAAVGSLSYPLADNDLGEGFTTGSALGYTLTNVDLDMSFATGTKATFAFAVHADSNGKPGTMLATLTAPGTLASGINTFTHAGLDLAAATKYVVVIDSSSAGAGGIRFTASNKEDGAQGWSITNGYFQRGRSLTTDYNFSSSIP